MFQNWSCATHDKDDDDVREELRVGSKTDEDGGWPEKREKVKSRRKRWLAGEDEDGGGLAGEDKNTLDFGHVPCT